MGVTRASAALRARRPRSQDRPFALAGVPMAFAPLWIPAFAGMTGEETGMAG